jgi:hypothetical protein
MIKRLINFSTIITLIVLLILIAIYAKLSKIFGGLFRSNAGDTMNEGFEVYKQLPFGYFETGSEPLSYYRLDRYRLPYRYPDVFMSNYPVPYFRYYD